MFSTHTSPGHWLPLLACTNYENIATVLYRLDNIIYIPLVHDGGHFCHSYFHLLLVIVKVIIITPEPES